jgi:peroxiredoxin
VSRATLALASLLLHGCASAAASHAPLWEQPGTYGAVRPEMGSPQPGDVAPDFALPDTAGAPFRLASTRGSWVVLHFTASWCPFCDAEVEHLGELAVAYGPRGVRAVLVDVEEEAPRWATYASEHVPPSVVALRDEKGDAAKQYAPPHAQPSFQDRAQVVLDATLIIDPRGRIRMFLLPDSKHFDPTFAAVRRELDRLLAGSDAPPPRSDPPVLPPERVVTVDVTAPAQVAPGGQAEAVVTLSIADGYHVMSDHPSDRLHIATHVQLDDGAGVTFGAPRYPPPVNFALADRAIATFQGRAQVVVPFQVAPDDGPAERTVSGTVRYQSCTESSCLFPVTRRIEGTVRVGRKR